MQDICLFACIAIYLYQYGITNFYHTEIFIFNSIFIEDKDIIILHHFPFLSISLKSKALTQALPSLQ